MSDRVASAEPDALERFETVVDAVADGLATRIGQLDDALVTYTSTCAAKYRAPTDGAAATLTGFNVDFRALGRWTGDVGRAFRRADTVSQYAGYGAGHPGDAGHLTDQQLVDRYLSEMDDPFRAVRSGVAEQLARDLGVEHDQDGPPAWLGHLESGGTYSSVANALLIASSRRLADLSPTVTVTLRIHGGTLQVLRNGRITYTYEVFEAQARLRQPSITSARLATLGRWTGYASHALNAITGFADQWSADHEVAGFSRVARSVTRGGGRSFFGFGAGWIGFQAGTVCGPAAWVCSPVLTLGFGFGGAVLGDLLAGSMPWMADPPDPPSEAELITEAIGSSEVLAPQISATVDLLASDLALDAASDDPFRRREIESILPQRSALEGVIATGEPWVVPPPPEPMGPFAAEVRRPPFAPAERPSMITTMLELIPGPSATPDPWGRDRSWRTFDR